MLRFYELNRNPDSTRNNYEVARFYAIAMESATSVVTLGEMYTEARHYSERTLEIEPSNIEALVLLIIMASSKDREVDDKWISDLVKNLQHTKLNYTAIESINSLLNCFGSGECRLDKSTVSAIISALVRNTYLVGHRGGTVYLYLSRFYLKYTNDIETAIYFAEKTAGFLPEKLNIRIYVASLYINFGQYESARKHLEYVRKQDRFGIYRKDTDDLYARIYNNRL